MSEYPNRDTQFSATNQPKKNGRKPSQFKKFIKENNLSVTDVPAIFFEIGTKPISEIKDWLKSNEDKDGKPLSALVYGLALAWIADCKRGLGGGGVFSQMMDRMYGKVKDKVEISGSMSVTQYTPEQRRARLDELERKRHERETKEQDSGTV